MEITTDLKAWAKVYRCWGKNGAMRQRITYGIEQRSFRPSEITLCLAREPDLHLLDHVPFLALIKHCHSPTRVSNGPQNLKFGRKLRPQSIRQARCLGAIPLVWYWKARFFGINELQSEAIFVIRPEATVGQTGNNSDFCKQPNSMIFIISSHLSFQNFRSLATCMATYFFSIECSFYRRPRLDIPVIDSYPLRRDSLGTFPDSRDVLEKQQRRVLARPDPNDPNDTKEPKEPNTAEWSFKYIFQMNDSLSPVGRKTRDNQRHLGIRLWSSR
jgi:hypothetical protein